MHHQRGKHPPDGCKMITQALLIPIDADALASIIRDAVRSELANYTPPPPKQQLPEYLTRHEVAGLYRVSLTTLHDWERQGAIIPKRVKIGGRVRYKRDEVLATLNTAKQFKHKVKLTAVEG